MRDNKETELLDEVLFVQKFIELLYENTDDMTFARYPITAKKDSHFYSQAEDNVMINLHVLRQWALRIFKVLDSISGYIDYQVDEMKEWRAETKVFLLKALRMKWGYQIFGQAAVNYPPSVHCSRTPTNKKEARFAI